MKLLVIALSFIAVSCATRPLTEKEKSVRILRQSDAEKHCIEKGKVYGHTSSMLTFDGIEEQMKIDAFALDADTIVLISHGPNKSGIAFKCDK